MTSVANRKPGLDWEDGNKVDPKKMSSPDVVVVTIGVVVEDSGVVVAVVVVVPSAHQKTNINNHASGRYRTLESTTQSTTHIHVHEY